MLTVVRSSAASNATSTRCDPRGLRGRWLVSAGLDPGIGTDATKYLRMGCLRPAMLLVCKGKLRRRRVRDCGRWGIDVQLPQDGWARGVPSDHGSATGAA